jgi:nitroreductase
MELQEAVLQRRSVRAFLPEPVPRDKLLKILDIARWAPSWGNTQPWQIVVADGSKCKALADLFEEEGRKGVPPRPDIVMPSEFQGIYKQRYMDLGKSLLGHMGIERDDKEARIKHYLNMYRFFGAPCIIYLLIDAQLSVPYSCLDIGSIGTTICYAALQEGLGTIYLAAAMHFPDLVRKVLSISDHKKVVIGIACGYPDPHSHGASFRSSRDPVDSLVTFA